jgi:hypothetical protein
VLCPRREKGFEFLRLFEIFAPRFHASDHLVLRPVSAGVLRLHVAFAIKKNLNIGTNSYVVQLSAIVQLDW